jgi:dTDP-4-dehydrorhamnose reductase
MKIVLLGKEGQLGRELARTLAPLGELIALDKAQADLRDLPGLERMLTAQGPDLIVNAAAYTRVDLAESDEAAARRVNSDAVAGIAAWTAARGSLLVHYSSDYVFDGEKPGAYVEADAPRPLSVYGRTKCAGERAILDSGCRALVFRTSWVFSAHGSNFVRNLLRLARECETLDVVADQHGAPTAAHLIAEVTALALSRQRSAEAGAALEGGLYHLSASGEASWYELACHVVRRARTKGAPLRLAAQGIRPIAANERPLPARRPGNSRLNTSRLAGALGLEFPHWTRDVDRVVDQLCDLELATCAARA